MQRNYIVFNYLFHYPILIYIFFYFVLFFFSSVLLNVNFIQLIFANFFFCGLYLIKKENIIFIRKLFIFFYIIFIAGFLFLIAFVFFIAFQTLFGLFPGKIIYIIFVYQFIQYERSVRFDFVTKADIVKKTPTLKLCKLIIITNIIVFSSYNIAANVFDIYFLFNVKLLFIIFFLASFCLCFIEINNYINFRYDLVGEDKKIIIGFKCVNFFLNNQNFVVIWAFTFLRIVGQITYEWSSYRYALPPVGGIVLCPQSVESNGEEGNILPAEESKKLEKALQNNAKAVEISLREIVVHILPENPSKDPKQFLSDVVNNVDAIRGLDEKGDLFREYKKQFEDHRKYNEEFSLITHDTFDEFLSCMRPMLVNAMDGKGNVDAFSYPVNDGKKVDFIVKGKGIQTKMTRNLSAGDLLSNRNKYKSLIEEESINFCVQTVYTKLDNPERIKTLLEEFPDVMRGQEALKRETFPVVKKTGIEQYFESTNANALKIIETQHRIQKQGYIPEITKLGKSPEIAEIKMPKMKSSGRVAYFVFRKIPK